MIQSTTKFRCLLLLLTLIAALAQMGCGKKKSSGHSGGAGRPAEIPPPQSDQFHTSNRATRFSDEFSLSCAAGICPAGTGVLFLSTHSSSGTCTAWIAGETEGKTVVMTNRHCVENVSDCASEVAFRFPESRESAQCARILNLSPYHTTRHVNTVKPLDYAVIQLDRRLSAKPLPISVQGLAPQSAISIRKAWVMGSRWAEMREENCETGTANVVVPGYIHALSPTVTFFNCAVKGGVSGSPVLNANGQVAAMVQMGPKDQSSRLTVPGLDTTEFDLQRMGIGSNMACVESVQLGMVASNPHCNKDQESIAQDFDKRAERELGKVAIVKAAIAEYFEFLSHDQTALFGWTVRVDDGNRVKHTGSDAKIRLEVVPDCVARADEPDNNLKRDFYSAGAFGMFSGWKTKGVVALRSPGWMAALKFDKYGAIKAKFSSGTKFARYAFVPSDLAELKVDQKATVVETVNGQSIQMQLPLCKPGARAEDLKDSQMLLDLVRAGDDAALEAELARQEARDLATSGR